jgi:hypothetical protein
MKDKNTLRKKIKEDPDFVYCPRLGNSLSKLVDKHPDGIDDERIEKVLLMSAKEVQKIYESALKKLRKSVVD